MCGTTYFAAPTFTVASNCSTIARHWHMRVWARANYQKCETSGRQREEGPQRSAGLIHIPPSTAMENPDAQGSRSELSSARLVKTEAGLGGAWRGFGCFYKCLLLFQEPLLCCQSRRFPGCSPNSPSNQGSSVDPHAVLSSSAYRLSQRCLFQDTQEIAPKRRNSLSLCGLERNKNAKKKQIDALAFLPCLSERFLGGNNSSSSKPRSVFSHVAKLSNLEWWVENRSETVRVCLSSHIIIHLHTVQSGQSTLKANRGTSLRIVGDTVS